MIVRGIVSETELKQIKDAAVHHEYHENKPEEFRTWFNNGAIWVEVDVNEDVYSYLKQSGFIEGLKESKSNRKEKKCMHE